MAKKVLIICTSADKLGGKETGCWMEEVAAPYFLFKEKGYDITIASIKGGEVPFDEASLNPPFLTKEAEKFLLDEACMKLVTESIPLSDVNPDNFDAVFVPGGHGTVVDEPDNPELAKLLGKMWDDGKVVAAVCHGPVAFANAKDASGEPIVKGRKVTGFSNSEEKAVAKYDDVPFTPETKLTELGGKYERGASDWAPHAVRDGKLVTGQNPASSAAVGELIIEALSS